MKNYTVNTNMLATGETVLIDGKVSFSRISRKMNAQEIEAENDRRRKGGKMSPIDPNKPYSYLELYDVNVRLQNPNQVRPIETYIREHCFLTPNSKVHPNSNCFTAKHSGNGLPTVCVLQPDGVATVETHLEENQELDTGLQVAILCKVFESKNSPNKGLALETVIVTDPRGIQFYQRNNAEETLGAYGYTFEATPAPAAPATPNDTAQTQNQVQGQMPNANQANQFSYNPQAAAGQTVPQNAMPAPQTPVQPQPQIPQGQVTQPAPQAPVQPQPQVPQGQTASQPMFIPNPNPAQNNSAFQPAPQAPVQPQAPQGQPVPQTGISYDPNDNGNRMY